MYNWNDACDMNDRGNEDYELINDKYPCMICMIYMRFYTKVHPIQVLITAPDKLLLK